MRNRHRGKDDSVVPDLWDISLRYDEGLDIAAAVRALIGQLRDAIGARLVQARHFPPQASPGVLQLRIGTPIVLVTEAELREQLVPLWLRLAHVDEPPLIKPCAPHESMETPRGVDTRPIAIGTAL